MAHRPWLDPKLDQEDPEKEKAAFDRIARATLQVVQRNMQGGAQVRARRDVHLKHHGCLAATFVVRSDLDPALELGVFKRGATYKAWVRLSNSSKRAQPDSVPDGRGLAIKLLDVQGPRLLERDRTNTQDFLLINFPAFFARNAEDMAEAAELEAEDAFPGSFFASPSRLRGFQAFLGTADGKVLSPLALTYFSQTPFAHGDHAIVKYRVRPVKGPERKPFDPSLQALRSPNYLFDVLREELMPDPGKEDIVLEFAVQRRAGDHQPLDDATVIWDERDAPFEPIADLIIAPQHFDGPRRRALAEHISYNPWHGLVAHRPLGSINRARRFAYEASSGFRSAANQAPQPTYSIEEWEELSREEGDPSWSPPAPPSHGAVAQVLQLVGTLTGQLSRKLAGALYTRKALGLAPALLLTIVTLGMCMPDLYCKPRTLGLDILPMPSEDAIPPARLAPQHIGREAELERDPRYLFRYATTGSELEGGTPYWFYRILPKMFPERFDHKGWSVVGLDAADDQEYYTDYHGLPRGLVLSDTTVHVLGTDLRVRLKRVSFNCASCHRGGYIDASGNLRFADGMPNTRLDAARFKQVVFESFRDPRFTPDAVIAAIDRELAAQHAAEPVRDGKPTPSRLTPFERMVYRALVPLTKARTSQKPLAWMDARAANGMGRLDAFAALRFEFLGYPDDGALATVDLPSIWNQGHPFRRTHHYDGNTRNVQARNFGAIVGVGGHSISVHRRDVREIGEWIERDLKPPIYPFELDPAQIARGKVIYEQNCARCHGHYEGGWPNHATLLHEKRPKCMDTPEAPDTDPERAQAVDEAFVRKLNAFGAQAGLWPSHSFESTGGYLCPPLDGVWARAPYLHNGSIPTLEDLLKPSQERPKAFVRGRLEYDTKKGGFKSEKAPSSDDEITFEFDTGLKGNGAFGHEHPIHDENQREDLIAYLLSL